MGGDRVYRLSADEAIRNGGVLATDYAGQAAEERGRFVGTRYIQDGPKCGGATSGAADCFLDGDARVRLIAGLEKRIDDAKDAYLRALTQLKIAALLDKSSEAPWIVSLLLDVVTFGVTSRLAKSLDSLRGKSVAGLAAYVSTVGRSAADEAIALRAHDALSKVTVKHLQGVTKVVGDQAKDLIQPVFEVSNAGAGSELAERMSLFDHLQQAVEVNYQALREQLPASANDAEMLALFHTLEAQNHSTSSYVILLQNKLTRFQHSGVTDIGRKQASRLDAAAERNPALDGLGYAVTRDTRVVWVEYPTGRRELTYQIWDGGTQGGMATFALDAFHSAGGKSFGPGEPETAAPELGAAVPSEFAAIALARHRYHWGGEPTTVKVAHPHWQQFVDRAQAPAQPPSLVATSAAPKPPVTLQAPIPAFMRGGE